MSDPVVQFEEYEGARPRRERVTAKKCGQWAGENVMYWPCSLPAAHKGPHSWHPRRREWELEQEVAELRERSAVVRDQGGNA